MRRAVLRGSALADFVDNLSTAGSDDGSPVEPLGTVAQSLQREFAELLAILDGLGAPQQGAETLSPTAVDLTRQIAREVETTLTQLLGHIESLEAHFARLQLSAGSRDAADSVPGTVSTMIDQAIGAHQRMSDLIAITTNPDARKETRPDNVLREVCDVTLRSMPDDVSIDLDIRSLPLIRAATAELWHLYAQLLFNAIESLTVAQVAGHKKVSLGIFTWVDEEGRAVIEIKDNGAGLSSLQLQHAALRLPQPTAAGLNINICRFIAESLGGTLTVDIDDEWNRYSVRLPQGSPADSQSP